jgi:hypothetical protein
MYQQFSGLDQVFASAIDQELNATNPYGHANGSPQRVVDNVAAFYPQLSSTQLWELNQDAQDELQRRRQYQFFTNEFLN